MKPGDLVIITGSYALPDDQKYKEVGLVIECYPEEAFLEEAILVSWGNCVYEIEFPHWLEVISEG